MAHLAKTLSRFRPALRAGAGIVRVLSRLAGTARFSVDAVRAHRKALHIVSFVLLAAIFHPSSLWAAPMAGITLTNTATANFQIGGTSFTRTAAAAVVTDAT